jgi:hypothetical protein
LKQKQIRNTSLWNNPLEMTPIHCAPS